MAARPSKPIPQIRVVYVTDSHCGVAGLEKRNRHVETLACIAKGAHLQLYDRYRDVLYEIQYISDDLRVDLQNNYSGKEINAQGLWDESEQLVKLQSITPFSEPERRSLDELD